MCENTLHPLRLQQLAQQWLLEDCPHFDFALASMGTAERRATVLMKGAGLLAGRPFADALFCELGLRASWLCREGGEVAVPSPVARVWGTPSNLLLVERVALNILSRASGVASGAHSLLRRLRALGWSGSVAGTRKTTPGFRMVEKYALLVGGVHMHRYDLSSMVMVKDNHIALAGSVTKAVEDARNLCSFTSKIEVECCSLEQAVEACEAKCDIVMFDNFTPKEFKEVASALKARFPRVIIEASGGITEENASQYVSPHVDVISCSSLVQGYRTIDFSMKIDPLNTMS